MCVYVLRVTCSVFSFSEMVDVFILLFSETEAPDGNNKRNFVKGHMQVWRANWIGLTQTTPPYGRTSKHP
mgnify:CR=1 FL=1